MPELLRMMEVSASDAEATLTSWPVPENQRYAAADVIAVIETAKAAVDLEADSDGVILRQLVPAGTDVRVGEAIALIAAPDEVIEDIDAALAALGVSSSAVAAAAPTPAPPTPAPPAPAPPSPALPSSATSSPAARPPATQSPAPPPAGTDRSGQRVFSSPLARRLARDAGLSLASIAGTGPGGRVLRRDIETAVASAAMPPPPTTEPAPAAPVPGGAQHCAGSTGPAGATDSTDLPHSKARRLIASRLTASKQTIPHFYLRATVRVDRLLRLRAQLNETLPVKVSVNDLVVKAVAAAHVAVPEVNVLWTEDAIRRPSGVDLAVAVATPRGLVTPVLRGVDTMTISAVAAATREVVERAKQGRLSPADLEGGTATVTNLGMYGTAEFAAIINPPQSSILAVGAARTEPAVTAHGRVKPRTVMTVTLSVDHRPIDGALAATWLSAFVGLVEQPLRILA